MYCVNHLLLPMLQSWFCWYHAGCLCFRAAVCSVLCEPPVVTNASVVVLLVSHELFAVSGPRFAVYCVNHLLLPMLQSWFCWYHMSCLCFRAAVCSVLCEPPAVTNASVVVLLVSRWLFVFQGRGLQCTV